MWMILIGALVELAVFLIKRWIENRDDQDEAIKTVGDLAKDAAKTGDTRPLKDFIAKLRAERKAKRG